MERKGSGEKRSTGFNLEVPHEFERKRARSQGDVPKFQMLDANTEDIAVNKSLSRNDLSKSNEALSSEVRDIALGKTLTPYQVCSFIKKIRVWSFPNCMKCFKPLSVL